LEYVTVFSCDPGTKNFACSVIKGRFDGTNLRVKIVGTCMLPEEVVLIDLTKNVGGKLSIFSKHIRRIIKKYGPDIACFERYQSRGLKGKTIEAIGYMLGVLGMMFKHGDPQYILAATWKTRINRFPDIDLKKIEKKYGLTTSKKDYRGKRNHEMDSVLIGLYKMHKHFGLRDFQIFEEVDFTVFMDRFINSPELTY
jgi:hypothetical protein